MPGGVSTHTLTSTDFHNFLCFCAVENDFEVLEIENYLVLKNCATVLLCYFV